MNSLVDYASSSEEETGTVEVAKTEVKSEQKTLPKVALPVSYTSETKSLRQPDSRNNDEEVEAKKEVERVLGGGIKNTMNGAIQVNVRSMEVSHKSITSFVPSSIRKKADKVAKPAHKTSHTSVSVKREFDLFGVTKHVRTPRAASLVNPVNLESGYKVVDDVVPQETLEPEEAQQNYNIKEFNVSEFYEQNEISKAQGLIEEIDTPLKSTKGTNQLSKLIKVGAENSEKLERMYETKRQKKKDSNNVYGFN